MIESIVVAKMDLVDLLKTRLEMSKTALDNLGLDISYKRPVWNKIGYHLQLVLSRKASSQWLIMTGLRGVGKTTLLSQVYHHQIEDNLVKKFYLSFDETRKFPGLTIGHFVEAVEQLRQIYQKQVLVLLLDEVHYLADWQTGCKLLFDNIRPLFLICTGSSALNLNANNPGGRRAVPIRIPPISLAEACQIQTVNNIRPAKTGAGQIGDELQRILFKSKTATEVYQKMADQRQTIDNYYKQIINVFNLQHMSPQKARQQIIRLYIESYLTLPFVLPHFQPNRQGLLFERNKPFVLDPKIDYAIRSQILQVIKKSLVDDIYEIDLGQKSLTNRHSKVPINLLPDLLLHLANNEQTSLTSLSKKLNVNYLTVKKMINIIKSTEIIYEIAPRGSNIGKSTKVKKYLFASPALRQALLYLDPQEDKQRLLRGQLLEDTIAMYLGNYLKDIPYSTLEYDSRPGGADFVFRPTLNKSSIVIEVGYTKNNSRQVQQTIRPDDLYGLVISLNNELKIDKSGIVFVPLEYFLLL